MKSLHTIQKTFRILGIITRIMMILSFAAAAIALTGVLCCIAWYGGGTVVGPNPGIWQAFTQTASLNQMLGALLPDAIFALTDGILFLLASRYFKAEQADGTPFTHTGAKKIKQLGICIIVLSLAAAVISEVISACFDLTLARDWSNLSIISIGIVLILASLIFRYGAELEAKKNDTFRLPG